MSEQARMRDRKFEECCESAMRDRPFRAGTPGCPMSGMCARVAGAMPVGWFLALAGVILVGLGVLVIVEPKVLVWLMAGMVIVMGMAALVGAVAARRLGAGRS